MSKSLFFILTILLSLCATAQKSPSFGTPESHEYYVSQLISSKDRNFQEIIDSYEEHIRKTPNDIIAQIELCKFIGSSYWDEYEDYNLKYEETEECIANLATKYPSHPKVLVYRSQNLYGNEKYDVLKTAEDLIETNPSVWGSIEIAEVNKMLGEYYQGKENWRAIQYFKKAQKLNDRIDVSLVLATMYEEQGKDDLARAVLLPDLEKDTTIWRMNQKAKFLLKLDKPKKALYLFDIIGERDSTYIDNQEMATAFADLGEIDKARTFLVRDTLTEWGRLNAKQELYTHDIQYSSAKVALNTYRSLQKESSYDDYFAVKRIRIAFKNPLMKWNSTEIFHLFLLYGLVLVTFLLPYLWVLPVYGLGALLRKSGVKVKPVLNFSWNISHFWLVSFFYLLVSVLTLFVFEYQDTMNHYFDLGNSYAEELDQTQMAHGMIFFVLCMAGTTLLVLRGKKIKDVFQSNLSIRQMIGLGVLFTVFNRFFIKGLSLFVDIENTVSTNMILSVKAEIMAVLSQHGFMVTVLLVAVIVPIYEEIVFRGVILSAVEKYLGFKGANIIQAILFALVHDDLALFPFFFVFALITGYWVRRSGGLLTGIVFHGIHNFSVVVALYYVSKLTVFAGYFS